MREQVVRVAARNTIAETRDGQMKTEKEEIQQVTKRGQPSHIHPHKHTQTHTNNG